MNDFIKMDVFFVTTTTVVVVLGIVGTIVLWRLSRILKKIEHISHQVSLETDTVRSDLAEMREEIWRGKGRLKSLWNFFGKVSKRATKTT